MKITIDEYDYLDSARLFSLVAEQEWAAFLDSGILNQKPPVSKHADFDVLAIKPEITLVCEGEATAIEGSNKSKVSTEDPLELLNQYLPNIKSDKTVPYMPGAIGYFSYDLARRFEQLPNSAVDDEHLPEMAMGIYSSVVVVDHRNKKTLLVSVDLSPKSKEVLTEWRELIDNALDEPVFDQHVEQRLVFDEISECTDRDGYDQKFDAVRNYTIDGDCYQINLAKRFSSKVISEGNSWLTYVALRQLSPAPYAAYFNYPFATVLSNSPESFIRCREGHVVTSPIKGTKARDRLDKVNDKKIAEALYNSAKDRAENVMIVDLMRNDLSRCCELGSVKVPSLFTVHSFANVHHLISTIEGKLKSDLHSLDLLRACFPGGSITGAPKIRAMQIIEELETYRRGLYCGAIGYVGMNGDLETNIAIRTIVIKDGEARFAAGGGLVIDSNRDDEYQEIIDKASMMTQTLTST